MSNPKIDQLINEGYEFKLGEYISQGWDIFKKEMGGIIGFLLIMWVSLLILGFIPLIGTIVSWIVQPSLIVGVFIVADKIAHNEHYEFKNFFDGFKKVWKLFAVNLLMLLIMLIISTPLVLFILVKLGFPGVRDPAQLRDFITGSFAIVFGGSFVILIPILYLSVSYSFAKLIAYFTDLGVWESMEASRKIVTKKWFNFFALFLVLGLINMLGLLLIGLGLLITVPLTFCTIYAAFNDIVGTREETTESPDLGAHFLTTEQ